MMRRKSCDSALKYANVVGKLEFRPIGVGGQVLRFTTMAWFKR